MKNLILFAAMAAIAVSCAKTGEINPVSEQAIGFDTWKNNLTKATTTTPHEGFKTGDKFGVFGYKQTGTEKTVVFNGDDVTLDANGSWNYSGIRFWDRTTDSYSFFAISPAGAIPVPADEPNDNANAPAKTGLFVTNDISFNGRNGDILVAKKKNVLKSSYGLAVDLEFVPEAALFDLKVKKAKNLEEAELKINSISIQNIQTKGNLTVSGYDGDGVPETAWSLAAASETSTFNNTHGLISVPLPTIDAGVSYGTANSVFLINKLIVMPQALITNEQQLVINYSITFGGETITHSRTIDLNKFDTSDVDQTANRDEASQNAGPFITSWEPGKHYTYYLTINADLIVFSATICDWTDADAFHYIIN